MAILKVLNITVLLISQEPVLLTVLLQLDRETCCTVVQFKTCKLIQKIALYENLALKVFTLF